MVAHTPTRTTPAQDRQWIHPSELPNFEALATTTSLPRVRTVATRLIAGLMAIALVTGGIVLLVNRGARRR